MSAVEDPEALGQRIRALRDREDWSQKDLAERSGVRQALISEIERGRTDPRYTTLRRLARAFGMTVQELISGELVAAETVHRQAHAVSAV